MKFIDQIFTLKINRNMMLKSLNLEETETEKINAVLSICNRKIQLLEIPHILECVPTILEQYYFVYYPLDILSNRIAMYFFKKKWNIIDKIFESDRGLCHKSFILDFNLECSFVKNWKNIVNNHIKLDELHISYLQEHNIKPDDYPSFYSLYHRYHHSEFTVTGFWGETTSPWCIDWIITIENVVKQNYGIYKINNDDVIPPYFEFKNGTIKDLYFPKYVENNLLYQYITKYSSFKCDFCDYLFAPEQNLKYIWHHSHYGDLCNSCYLKNKKDYFYTILKKRKILLQGLKNTIFKLEVEQTRRILDGKILPELSLEKKQNILDRVLREIIKSRNVATCSICLDVLQENICAGSCGHCFHQKCIDNLVGNKCPVCRTKTNFQKLHWN